MIGEDIKATVFRDTKTFYAHVPQGNVAEQLISFARKHAGNSILDLGCATGNYARRLMDLGYAVEGADINQEYVAIAQSRGVKAHHVGATLPFADGSFDTVVMFEVMEHLPDPDSVLKEARRVARKNLIVTTPNCDRVADLQRMGLLFEHFADLDHRNFFTPSTLRELLLRHFRSAEIVTGDGINPLALMPWKPVRFLGLILTRLHLLTTRYYFRLFAVASK